LRLNASLIIGEKKMQTGYLVVANDGQEYGLLDRATIQQWY